MSVLAGFLSTWTQARTTFGEGVPEPGATFDSSAALHQLETDTGAAAPAAVWSGAAADAYDIRNAEQVRTLSRMAELDESIGLEVDRSAAVVVHGRRQLDTVKDWVLAAAGSVPKGSAGEQMLVPIVAKGCSDITEIVTTSNGELATIAQRIRMLGSEYGALGGAGEPTQANPPARGPTR